MLLRLQLVNFRNYRELSFAPPLGLTVLSGPNGSGKSNLLEGIHLLGTGYSFRQVHDESLVRWGADFFAVRGEIGRKAGEGTGYLLETVYQRSTRRKITRVNGKRELPSKVASLFPLVLFSPQDLLLIQGAPALRRRFLDVVITQCRPQHASDLHSYQSILQQRNNLLRRGGYRQGELDPWNLQLVTVGARILRRRLSAFRSLMRLVQEAYLHLGGSGEIAGEYAFQTPAGRIAVDEGTCLEMLQKALSGSRCYEERFRATVVGPHRDDLKFFRDGHEVRLYSSQGEQRLLALALKIGHYRLLSRELGETPLLLLDDVFSELDEERRQRVIISFTGGGQVLATSAGLLIDPGQIDAVVGLTPEINAYLMRS